MLYTKTVEPRTLSLLKELMQLPVLNQFSLVGGTALSLKYGHRISIDLDLFTDQQFQKSTIEADLRSQFSERFLYESTNAKWGIFCYIDNIKVDIVNYPHPIIGEIETFDSIRFYSDKDLMAM